MLDFNNFNKINTDSEEWITNYKRGRFEKYNSLEFPKWKRIRLDGFTMPQYKEYIKAFIYNEDNNENLIVKDINSGLKEHSELNDYINIKESYGIDEKFVSLSESINNSGVYVKCNKNYKSQKSIKLSYLMDKENPLVIDHNIIIADENSEVTVVFDYITSDDIKAFQSGVTKVYANENSIVNVIKIHRMNDISNHFDSNIAYVKGYGKVNWITVQIGSDIGATSYITNLNGDNSEADLKSVYFGDGNRKLDLGYTMNHRGMRSISNIDCKGALKDSSKKIFRGNLDFKKGARRSKGSEKEFVLLLDKTVKCDAIPALLCSEDDVEGEHAASAGQINENQLFYLMSRGFSEKEAEKLIVEASFRPIIDSIPDEALREAISENIHRRLINA